MVHVEGEGLAVAELLVVFVEHLALELAQVGSQGELGLAEPAAEIELTAEHPGAGVAARVLDARKRPQFGLETLALNRRLERPALIVRDRFRDLDLAQDVVRYALPDGPEVVLARACLLACGPALAGAQLEVERLHRLARRAHQLRHRGHEARPVSDHAVDAGRQGLEGVAAETVGRRPALASIGDVVDVHAGGGKGRLAGVDPADQPPGQWIAQARQVEAGLERRGAQEGDGGDGRQDSGGEHAHSHSGRPGVAGMHPAGHVGNHYSGRRSGECAGRGEDDDLPRARRLESTGGPAGGCAGGHYVVDQEHDAVPYRGGSAAGEGDSRVQEALTAAAADLRPAQGPPSQRGRQRPAETPGERPGDRVRVVAAASEPPAPVHGHGYDNVGAAQLDSQSSVRLVGDVEAQVVEAAVLQAQDDLVERRVVRPEPEETVATFQPVSAGRAPGPGFEQPPARPAQPEFPFGRGRAGEAGPGQEQPDGEGGETPRQPTDVLRR